MKDFDINKFADANDAYVKEDRDGDFAVCGRIRDENGIEQVRFAPDACDFHPIQWWEKLSEENRVNAIS